jgi:membrane protease YdiL (CAAX protease family)
MPWDFVLILAALGIFVPWRGTVRIRQLLQRERLTTVDRLSLYASTLAFQWLAAAVVFWRALSRHLTLAELALALPGPGRALAIGIGLSTLLVINQFASLRRLARLPPERRGFVGQLAARVMPQTSTERLVFVALVITVAICEEFLYRGFVQSIFQQASGGSRTIGILCSALFFSSAHLYQRKRGLASTFLMGVIFSAARVWTGSLIPSMLAHFATDISAGFAAPVLLRQTTSPAESAGSLEGPAKG